ncbi:MAG TPA: S49 family peptidase [Gemmataceae bacterium]|nr:S49 family peptidase [Gemmataceae bacterium]
MSTTRPLLLLPVIALLALGCHGAIRTENTVRTVGPVETHVKADLPAPVPNAGPVLPVVVQAGPGPDRVAILDVDGLLMNYPFSGLGSVGENPVALFREKLDAIAADACAKAVVLRVNSPGGGVAACITMRHDLERFKLHTGKPVIACLLDTATGGAYYLASAADRIVVGPASVTGGIGVVLNLYNFQDLMAQFNVFPQPIKSGEMVDIGSSTRPLKPQEKELLQTMADEFHGMLIADIRRSRPGIAADMTLFDGRLFSGSQAVQRRLADYVGDLDAAIQLAAGVGGGSPQVVLYRRSNDPARSPHAVTANIPIQGAGLLPNVPGLDRSKMPTFLSLWQPELTMEKLGGK